VDDESRDELGFRMSPSGLLAAEGHEVEVTPRMLTLLRALRHDANEFVPVERIIATLWPGAVPMKPTIAVQVYVSRLRMCIREVGCSDHVRIVSEWRGYRLIVGAPRIITSSPPGRPRRDSASTASTTPERALARPRAANRRSGRSWFRRARDNELVQGVAAVAAHAADSRLVLAQDAQVTATMLQHLGPVIESVRPMSSSVIRLGAMLLIKVDDRLVVHQLTAAQQLRLDHEPQLAMSPREILAALGISGELS
jgi:DNA-binding winged helix-turn-helix (wHTH) protein